MAHQTYEKRNLLLINNIHLVFSSLVIQRRLLQTKVYYKFSTLSERKRYTNLQQQQLQKNYFPSVYVNWYNLLRQMFFIPCNNWKTLLFLQIHRHWWIIRARSGTYIMGGQNQSERPIGKKDTTRNIVLCSLVLSKYDLQLSF